MQADQQTKTTTGSARFSPREANLLSDLFLAHLGALGLDFASDLEARGRYAAFLSHLENLVGPATGLLRDLKPPHRDLDLHLLCPNFPLPELHPIMPYFSRDTRSSEQNATVRTEPAPLHLFIIHLHLEHLPPLHFPPLLLLQPLPPLHRRRMPSAPPPLGAWKATSVPGKVYREHREVGRNRRCRGSPRPSCAPSLLPSLRARPFRRRLVRVLPHRVRKGRVPVRVAGRYHDVREVPLVL
eukprot:1877838-Rhodomonas_salina.1